MGISIANLTKQLGEYFGVEDGDGVLVRSVKQGSRGEKAGLQAGDIIIEVDDEAIDDTRDLRMALRERRGKALTLTVVRDKREQTLTVPEAEEEAEEESSLEFPFEAERTRLLAEAKRARIEARAALAERAAAVAEARRAVEDNRRAVAETRRAVEEARRIRLRSLGEIDESI